MSIADKLKDRFINVAIEKAIEIGLTTAIIAGGKILKDGTTKVREAIQKRSIIVKEKVKDLKE